MTITRAATEITHFQEGNFLLRGQCKQKKDGVPTPSISLSSGPATGRSTTKRHSNRFSPPFQKNRHQPPEFLLRTRRASDGRTRITAQTFVNKPDGAFGGKKNCSARARGDIALRHRPLSLPPLPPPLPLALLLSLRRRRRSVRSAQCRETTNQRSPPPSQRAPRRRRRSPPSPRLPAFLQPPAAMLCC